MMANQVQKKLGLTIRIFLVDGRPEGLRLVEMSNWSGRGIVCSRAQYPSVRNRDEFVGPGIYILVGPGMAAGMSARVYIGEADELRSRLDQQKSKDFWTSFVAFGSKDDNLNKAHVRYLESRLIAIAVQADRAELENGNTPPPPHLSRADIAEMEAYLENVCLLLPVVGVHAFEATVKSDPIQSGPYLLLRGPQGAQATGEDRADGFLVAAGSTARLDPVPSIHPWIAKLRDELRESGVLAVDGPVLRLMKPHLFESPSAAAGVVLGKSANGRTEWKDEIGRTLKEIQAAQLPESRPSAGPAPSTT